MTRPDPTFSCVKLEAQQAFEERFGAVRHSGLPAFLRMAHPVHAVDVAVTARRGSGTALIPARPRLR
jgi:hypothetical protein